MIISVTDFHDNMGKGGHYYWDNTTSRAVLPGGGGPAPPVAGQRRYGGGYADQVQTMQRGHRQPGHGHGAPAQMDVPAAAAGRDQAGDTYSVSFSAAPDAPNGRVVNVQVNTPDIHPDERRPLDVVIVTDTSGSMGGLAGKASLDGEADPLSRLELVQHAAKTVFTGLKSGDRGCLVEFQSYARVVHPLSDAITGRDKAIKSVESLEAGGGTELWEGIKAGLDVAVRAVAPGRTTAVMVLTDGEPSDRNHLVRYREYLHSHPQAANVVLSTYGFGYSLNSTLLTQISAIGGGLYSFVPDCSMVGTAFVNNLANLMATMEPTVRVRLETSGDAHIVNVLGELEGCGLVAGRRDAVISLGTMNYGQSRNVFPIVSGRGGALKVTVLSSLGSVTAQTALASLEYSPAAEAALFQTKFATCLVPVEPSRGLDTRVARKEKAARFCDELKASAAVAAGHPSAVALLDDVTGQVAEALARDDYYRRWGQHYLPSLARSHMLQQCSNFKDFGLQVYGGAIFKAARDEAEEIFIGLPPPVAKDRYGHHRPRNVSMAAYHNPSGGCFHGLCLVSLADGTKKPANQIKKGDAVVTGGTGSCEARIRCVVRTSIPSGQEELCEFSDGLVITPFHPVRQNGRWEHPKNIVRPQLRPVDFVYTFVVDHGPSVFVSGIECATLGHGLADDTVRHSYLGTAKVVDDLKQIAGYDDGLVDLVPSSFIRDPVTQEVCRISVV